MAEELKTDEKTLVALGEQPEFKQMMGVMAELGKTVQSLTAGQQATNDAIAKLATGITAPPLKKEEPAITDDQVNEMSQAELAAHIFKGNRKMLEGLGKDLSDKISTLTETTSSNYLSNEVREFKRDHKDLEEWLPEIKQAVSEGRFTNLKDAYNGVKVDDPEKVIEVDKKYADGDDETKGEEVKSFGGLLPTSGGGADKIGEGETLTREEGQEKAWTEIFGDNPDRAGEDTD